MLKTLAGLSCLCFLLLVLSFANVQAQIYTVTDLGATSTAYPNSYANGISPSGNYVVGKSNTDSQNYNYFPSVWTSSTGLRVVETSNQGTAYAVNDSGHMAVQFLNNSSGHYVPGYFNGSHIAQLPVVYWGCSYGINSHDTLCGTGAFSSSYNEALWYNPSSGIYDIGRLPGASGYAASCGYAINENGSIVGSSAFAYNGMQQHAFLWTPTASNAHTGSMADIHTSTDYTQSCAMGINGNNEVVGYCYSYYGGSAERAFYKSASGAMQILPGVPGPYPGCEADSINDSGTAVGTVGYLDDTGSGASFAARWVGGQLQMLYQCIDLRSPWRLDEAHCVNANGQIVGRGKINGWSHAFLLTPIADPVACPTPSISSVDPASVSAVLIPAIAHVYGTGFTSGSVVYSVQSDWVYPQPLSTTYISPTQLDVTLSSTDITSIWVLNPLPGGGPSNTVSITVRQDQAPVAVNCTAICEENGTVTIDVLASDYDPDPGDAISISWVYPSANGGAAWRITDPVTGKQTIGYRAPYDFTGTDTFDYTISDRLNYQATATVTVDVCGAPVAVNDSVTCIVSQSTSIDVLANDINPGLGDIISIASWQSQTDQGGTTDLLTDPVTGKQTISYNPPQYFTGTDTFTYGISDILGQTSSATVTVQVEQLPLTAMPDFASCGINSEALIDVLANDSDPNPSSYIWISDFASITAQGGWCETVESNGQYMIEYFAPPDFTGTDTFDYTITDSYGLSATATVTVKVGTGVQILQTDVNAWLVCGGDNLGVSVQVNDPGGTVTGVTADGVSLVNEDPSGNWWQGQVPADSALGWHDVNVVATDDGGFSANSAASYQTARAFATNTLQLTHPLMEQMWYQDLFVVCGLVTTIPGDAYDFYLSDNAGMNVGCGTIPVYCSAPHGLSDGDFVRVRGIYEYYCNPNYLDVYDNSHEIYKLQ